MYINNYSSEVREMKSAEIVLLTLLILTIVYGIPSVASDKMFRNDSWHSDDGGKLNKSDHRNFTTQEGQFQTCIPGIS